MIRKTGKRTWTLYFSDGRKETFGSLAAAKRRERQVQFFKHRGKRK